LHAPKRSHNCGIDKRISELGIAGHELIAEKCGIPNVVKEREVEWLIGQMWKVHRLQLDIDHARCRGWRRGCRM
jgi:hypothetical protein